MQLCLIIYSGMANKVGPDQTAPSGSESELLVYAILSETLVYEILGRLL